MKSKNNILFAVSFCIILIFSANLFPESKTEGEVLLESKKYREAEKYAESALYSNPGNSKAEFILVKAWIGLGYEAEMKRNYNKALEYFEKAQSKWPLNDEVRKEILKLRERQTSGTISRFNSEITAGSSVELRQEILSLRSEFENYKLFTFWIFGAFTFLFALQVILLVFKFYKK